MARENLEIRVTDTGVLKVTNGMNALGAAGNRAASSAALLKKALGYIGGSLVLRQLARTADSYRNIANRIATVTKSHEEAAAVMDRVFKIANDTRQSFEATGIVYARVANSATDLGKSHEEVLSLVRGLNQAMAIGGTTSREANAALIQFSQGLASGTLRGDELRSVLEQSVVVSEVLSRGLGVTRGELKKMGEAGLISSQQIFKAFKDMSVELEERFGELVPTLSQSFEIFKNYFIKFIGEINEASGVTQVFGKALVWLGKNLSLVAKVLSMLAGRFVLGLVITRFAALSLMLRARFANPFTALVTTLGALVSLLALAAGGMVAFADKITIKEAPKRDADLQSMDQMTSEQEKRAKLAEDEFASMEKMSLLRKSFGILNKQEKSERDQILKLQEKTRKLQDKEFAVMSGMTQAQLKLQTARDMTKYNEGLVKATKLSHLLTAVWEDMAIGIKQLPETIATVVTKIVEAFTGMVADIDFTFTDVFLFSAHIADGMLRTFTFVALGIAEVFRVGFHNIKVAGEELVLWADRTARDAKNWLPGKINKLVSSGATVAFSGAYQKRLDAKDKEIAMYRESIANLDALGNPKDTFFTGLIAEAQAAKKVIQAEWDAAEDRAIKLGKKSGKAVVIGAREEYITNIVDLLGDILLKVFSGKGPIEEWAKRTVDDAQGVANRVKKAATGLDDKGPDRTKEVADAAAAKARADTIKDFRAMENAMFPVLAAYRDQAEATDLLTRAMKIEIGANGEMLVSRQRASEMLQIYADKLWDAKHPYEATLRDMREEIDLYRLGSVEREKAIAWKEIEKKFTDQKIKLDEDQITKLKEEAELLRQAPILAAAMAEQMAFEKSVIEALNEPQQTYAKNMAVLNKWYLLNTDNAKQYNAAAEKLRATLLDSKLDAGSGIERSLIRIKQEMRDLASATDQIVTSFFSSYETMVVGSITGFTEGWDKGLENMRDAFKTFVDDMLEQLTRLLLRWALFSLVSGPAGGGLDSIATLGAGDNGVFRPPGLQHGGQWRVGGQGGPDSQLVQFMASPKETVTVTNPGQGVASQPPVVNVKVINQIDPNETIEALNTPAGERIVMNMIRRNSSAVRKMVAV